MSIKKYDLVWIEKEIYPYLPAYFEKLLNIINVKYIVDFDDAIFHNYDLSNNIFVKKILFSKIDNVMKSACLVTCGNKYLKEKALLSGSKKIEILPTVIDINKYQLLSKNNKNRLIIGWIGSPTSIVHFNLIMNSLKKISRDFDIEIRIIGAKLFDKELNINCLDWCEESEVDEINRFDIGIMPLVDSPWEKGKCGFKLIQYMACGIPVIASPVGVNKTIVQDGYNGFQASTEEEWYKAFKILGASFKLRKKLGEHGRLLVEKKYSIQAIEHKVIGIFRNAAGR